MSGARDGTIDVHLRTQHVEYLNLIAEREEKSISRAFAMIVERYAEIVAVTYKSARKASKHLSVSPEHLSILDGRAAMAGLSRSELSRRLIDAAIIDDAIEAETGF
jgi:hypothetical protein